MPAKTKKTLKSKTKSNSFNFKTLSAVLGIFCAGLIVAVIFLAENQKTPEERKRLVAFEPLASAYIDHLSMYSEDGKAGKAARATDIGVTDDNDLYIDFTITETENHVPVSTRPGRLHFQCDDHSGLVITGGLNENGAPKEAGCAFAYWYGDAEETSPEFREKYRHYIEEIERITEAANSAETEEEINALHEEMEALNEEYKDFFKGE